VRIKMAILVYAWRIINLHDGYDMEDVSCIWMWEWEDGSIHISYGFGDKRDNSACERILAYWHSIGSPRRELLSPLSKTPWFPWDKAGFTNEERDALCTYKPWCRTKGLPLDSKQEAELAKLTDAQLYDELEKRHCRHS